MEQSLIKISSPNTHSLLQLTLLLQTINQETSSPQLLLQLWSIQDWSRSKRSKRNSRLRLKSPAAMPKEIGSTRISLLDWTLRSLWIPSAPAQPWKTTTTLARRPHSTLHNLGLVDSGSIASVPFVLFFSLCFVCLFVETELKLREEWFCDLRFSSFLFAIYSFSLLFLFVPNFGA